MKRLIFSLLLLVAAVPLRAQTDNGWAHLDSLVAHRLYNEAYPQAQVLFAQACSSHNSHAMLRGAFCLHRIANAYQENATDSALARYLSLLPLLAPAEQALCHSFLATLYHDYSSRFRWQLSDNVETGEPDLDYKLWPLARFDSVVSLHTRASLRLPSSLRSQDIRRFECFLKPIDGPDKPSITDSTCPPLSVLTTPTLYDLLVDAAIDNSAHVDTCLLLLRQLQDYHRSDTDTIRLYLDLRYLDLLSGDNRHTDYLNHLSRCLSRYRASRCPWLAMLYHRMAQHLYDHHDRVAALCYCDSAIALFPLSQGAASARQLRRVITRPAVNIAFESHQMAQRPLLAVATYRNTDSLFCRIVEWTDIDNPYRIRRDQVLRLPALRSWSQAVPLRHNFADTAAFLYLPSLPAGHYILLVSPSPCFDTSDLHFSAFACQRALIVFKQGHPASGYLLNTVTGAPIANHPLSLVSKKRGVATTIASFSTDDQGYFSLPDNKTSDDQGSRYLQARIDNNVIEQQIYDFYPSDDEVYAAYTLFFDRPLYRLGDTVSLSLLAYATDGHTAAHLLSPRRLLFELLDPNGRTVDSASLLTNDAGTASARFVLPRHGLPGSYRLRVRKPDGIGNALFLLERRIRVEEYKQPRFFVDMAVADSAYRQGDSVTIRLSARTFNGLPVSNAKVRWIVKTTNYTSPDLLVVASDTALTDAQGCFSFTFPTHPDTTQPDDASFVHYLAKADVTDLDGETHTASHLMMLGSHRGYAALSGPYRVSSLSRYSFSYTDSEGRPLAGTARLLIVPLQRPTRPLLVPPVLHLVDNPASVAHTLPQADFQRRYPLMAYRPGDVAILLQRSPLPPLPGAPVRSLSFSFDSAASHPLPDTLLPDGPYRLVLHVSGPQDDVDLDSAEVLCAAPRSSCHLSEDLFYAWTDTSAARIGDTIHLSFGTRFDSVRIHYHLYAGSLCLGRHHVLLSDTLCRIDIPVAADMVGGFSIQLFAVKENVTHNCHFSISVPRVDRQLDFTILSFRDRLLPGSSETWTLRIAPVTPSSSAAPYHFALTLYDAALDALTNGSHRWSLDPWDDNADTYFFFNHGPDGYDRSFLMPSPQFRFDLLQPVGRQFGLPTRFSSRRMPMVYGANAVIDNGPMMLSCAEEEVSDGTARGESAILSAKAAPNKARYVDNVVLYDVEEESAIPSPDDDEPRLQLRSNHSTLAFFHPLLSCDSTYTLTFTVPDLLTRWSLLGVAWNDDLLVGHLSRQFVTQKPLTVQPNLPRCLRQADSLDLVAKVSNLTDTAQSVVVTFSARFPASRLLLADTQRVVVGAHATLPVSFHLRVPDDADSLIYRFVAAGSRYADGEQGGLSVLPRRQTVTSTLALFINGAGTRRFAFPALATPAARFSLDFTPNPIWMAVRSLSFLPQCANPSNLYRINALYADSLACFLQCRYPSIADVMAAPIADTLTTDLHPFRLPATVTQSSSDDHLASLLADQRPDGSWGWMPGSHAGDSYITAYILKTNGQLLQRCGLSCLPDISVSRAIHYLDGQLYDLYRHLDSPLPKVANVASCHLPLAYLYARSFYPDVPLSDSGRVARDYYLHSLIDAVSHNSLPSLGLYASAQLALMLQRTGANEQACQVVRWLKAKALYSDEMGMYWRDNLDGTLWNQRPIEVQSMLIDAFATVTPADTLSVALMQQWLLKQKQTTRWSSDVATVNAVHALLAPCSSTAPLAGVPSAHTYHTAFVAPSAAPVDTLFVVDSAVTLALADTQVTVTKLSPGIAWGALFCQHDCAVDSIPYASTGVTMRQSLYRVALDGSLRPLAANATCHVGDRLRVRLLLSCDRPLQYVELRGCHASPFEPLSSRSGWRWFDGLACYLSVTDSGTSLFIDRLDRGQYVVEYDIWLSHSGSFALAPSVLQCLYAPAFRCTTAGATLDVLP